MLNLPNVRYIELRERVLRDGASSLTNAERAEYYRLMELGGDEQHVEPALPDPEEEHSDGTE